MGSFIQQTVLTLNVSESICSNLHDFLKEGFLCDFEVQVLESRTNQVKIVKCHKLVLSANSPLIKNYLKANEAGSKYILKDVPFQVVKSFVEALYYGRVVINDLNIVDMIYLAETLQVRIIYQEVGNHLMSLLNEGNCLWLREMTESRNLRLLSDKVEKYIKNHFSNVRLTNGFKEMPFNFLKVLVDSDNLCVENEYEVYESAMSWIRYDTSSRLNRLPELLSSVRFHLIKKMDLTNILFKEPLVEDYPNLIDAINQACSYKECPPAPNNKPIRHIFSRKADCEAINQSLICLGGKDGQGNFIRSIEVSNNLGKSWMKVGSMLKGICHFAAVKNKESIIIIGGLDEDIKPTRSCWKFNYFNNQKWTALNDLPEALYSLSGCCIGDRIYTTGGFDGQLKEKFKGTAAVYNLDFEINGVKWEKLKAMIEPRQGHLSITCQERIYSIGGIGTKSCERFKPLSNSWEYVSCMHNERSYASGCLHSNKIYVVGGQHRDAYLSSMEMYDPQSDIWYELDSKLKIPRIDLSMTSCDNSLFILGGSNEKKVKFKMVQELSHKTNYRWSIVGSPSTARTGHALVTLSKY